MSLQTATYQAVQRDLTFMFHGAVETATPFHPRLAMLVNSTSADEKYGWLGSSPGVREWLGPREFKQLRAADYLLKNRHWEASEEFEKTDVDDDRIGGFKIQIEQLADEASYHPDELLFEMEQLGNASPCYDGQFFFDTDHVWGDSGVQSNKLTSAAVSASDPTPEEFRDAFHAAVINMFGLKNDQGKPFIRPRAGQLGDLMCTVPLNMLEAATKAFGQILALEGGAATTNVVLETPEIVAATYAANGPTFHVYHTGGRIKPYIMQARQPLSFAMKGADDIEFKVLKAMTESRYNVGFGHWPSAAEVTFV